MKTFLILAITVFGVAVAGVVVAPKESMKITSSDFVSGGPIPARFTCEGENKSPSLRIEGAPATTQSLALILDDPDAPSGTFTHWVVWNIAPTTKEFPMGAAPSGAVQGLNNFGKSGYGGPCPPSGQHRYYFRVYALDVEVKLAAGASREALEKAMHGHVLAQGTLMGTYRKAH
jgi:hypothetical protein